MTWLALCLAAAVSAAELKAPEPIGLHPLLLGDPGVASPLGAALDARARALVAAGPASASETAARLAPALAGHPTERAAALLSARLMADPAAAESFLAARPALAAGPVGALPRLATADDPYRGSVGDPRTALGMLAEHARREPALSWLFDGSRPGPGLDGALRSGSKLLLPDGRKVKLRRDGILVSAEHPAVPGMTLEIDETGSWLLDGSGQRLAAAGAGPRRLGSVTLGNESGPLGAHRVYLRESVTGPTAQQLVDSGEFGNEELVLVTQLLARLARARVTAPALSLSDIVIGRTAAEPERRALIIGRVTTDLPEGLTDGEAFDKITRQPAFVGMEIYPAESLKPPREVWMPLEDLLRGSVRAQGPSWFARLGRYLKRH